MIEGMQPSLRSVLPCPACNVPTPEALLAASGIPPRYAHCTLDTFPAEAEKQPAVIAVRAWLDAGAASSLLLVGGNGRGKTGLAVSVVHELCRAGRAVRFIAVADLLDEVRATFDASAAVGKERVIARYRTVDVLVLDDLMAPSVTEWVREAVTVLLEARRSAGLATVITSDQRAPEIRAAYGDRLLSRLHKFTRVEVPGRDLRDTR
ncbi:MAG: ATP-binding protein [Dehalococcoidia bacterium]